MKRLVIIGIAVGSVAALAACEKPNPGASVWSGTNSEHSYALCWSADAAESVAARGCAQDVVTNALAGGSVPAVAVAPGDTLGISVDPIVADNGWYPVIGGQRLSQTPITDTYFRFTFPQADIPADGYPMEIVARGEGPDTTRGIWVYRLVAK